LNSWYGNCAPGGMTHGPTNTLANYLTSFSIDGPCSVVIEAVTGSNVNDTATFAGVYDGVDYGISGAANFPLCNALDFWVYGCFPQCYRGKCSECFQWGAECINVLYRGTPTDISGSCQNVFLGISTDTVDMEKVSVKIYPLFDNAFIETNVRAETVGYGNSPYNDFTMSLEDQPYMCSRIDLQVIRGFSASVTPNLADGTTSIPSTFNEWTNLPSPLDQINTIADPVYLELNAFDLGGIGFEVLYGYTFSTTDMYNFAYNQIIPPSIKSCKDAGRTIIDCPSCIVEQPEGVWEFNSYKYNPAVSVFPVSVSVLNQTQPDLSAAVPHPQVIANWVSTTSSALFQKLQPTIQFNQTRVFARLIAWLKLSDYREQFFLNDCVVVKQTPSATSSIPYELEPAVCVPKADHHPLCQYDYTRYAIQAGYQCNSCGASCRNGGRPDPNATAYAVNPLANAKLYPIQNQIADSYLDGNLSIYLTTTSITSIQWQLMYEFIKQTNISYFLAFPDARTFCDNSWSTRPGYTTPGLTSDPNQWLDCDWKNRFPIDCGTQCSSVTGICKPYRCIASQYCNPVIAQYSNLTTNPSNMSLTDYPLNILPVSPGLNFHEIQRCGQVIDPSLYSITDAYGLASPTNVNDFIVLETVQNQYVILSAIRSSTPSSPLQWQNTGRASVPGFYFDNDTTFYGTVYCSTTSCSNNLYTELWISPLTTDFSTGQAMVIGSVTGAGVPYTITLLDNSLTENNMYYQTLGFSFFNVTRGSVIKLTTIIASTETTIQECQQPINDLVFVEYPVCIEEATPNNICLFRNMDDMNLAGQCYCNEPSLGGTACEYPAVINPVLGKQVCNGYSRPGYMTYDLSGTLVTVNSFGVYETSNSNGTFVCNCINPGVIIQTWLNPSSRFIYPSIYVNEKPSTEPDYSVIQPPSSGSSTGLTYTNTSQACAGNSDILPSYDNGDEAGVFFATITNGQAVFTSLEINTDGNYQWNEPSGIVVEDESDATTQLTVSPCTVPIVMSYLNYLCQALNYNNLVFNTTGLGWTDGTLTNMTSIPPGVTNVFTPRFGTWSGRNGGVVQMFVNTTSISASLTISWTIFQVDGQNVQCEEASSSSFTSTITLLTYNCDQYESLSTAGQYAYFNFEFIGGTGNMSVAEVMIYYGDDKTRLNYIYQ